MDAYRTDLNPRHKRLIALEMCYHLPATWQLAVRPRLTAMHNPDLAHINKLHSTQPPP